MLSERPSVHYACPLCLPKVPELLPEEKRSNNFAWSLFRRQPAAAVSVKQAAAAETERVLSANQIQGCATTTCFISCFLCKRAGSFPLFPFSTFFSEAFQTFPTSGTMRNVSARLVSLAVLKNFFATTSWPLSGPANGAAAQARRLIRITPTAI